MYKVYDSVLLLTMIIVNKFTSSHGILIDGNYVAL